MQPFRVKKVTARRTRLAIRATIRHHRGFGRPQLRCRNMPNSAAVWVFFCSADELRQQEAVFFATARPWRYDQGTWLSQCFWLCEFGWLVTGVCKSRSPSAWLQRHAENTAAMDHYISKHAIQRRSSAAFIERNRIWNALAFIDFCPTVSSFTVTKEMCRANISQLTNKAHILWRNFVA